MSAAVRLCLRVTLGLVTLCVIGLLLFAWRLDKHPLALDRLVPMAEQALARTGGGSVDIGGMVLERDERGLMLHLSDVVVENNAGEKLVFLPEARVQISLKALMTEGVVAPERIVLEGLDLSATLNPGANIAIGVKTSKPVGTGRKPASETAAPLELNTETFLRVWATDPRLKYLKQVDLDHGNISVLEPARGMAWRAPNVSAKALRRGRDTVFTGGGRMRQFMLRSAEVDRALGEIAWTLTVTEPTLKQTGSPPHIEMGLALSDVDATVLTGIIPPLVGEHGLEAPISGQLQTSFAAGSVPESLGFDLTLGAGRISLADDAALRFKEVRIEGAADLRKTEIRLKRLLLKHGEGNKQGSLILTGKATAIPGGDIQVEASMEGIAPAWLASLSPDLSRFDGVDALFSGNASLTFDASGQLRDGVLWLVGGRTVINLPALFETPVALDGVSAEAELTDYGAQWRLHRLNLSFPGGADIQVVGEANRDEDGGKAAFDLSGQDLTVAMVKQFWPKPVSPPAREWVVSNIKTGQVPSLGGTVNADIGALGTPLALSSIEIDLRMPLRNLDLTYWAPLPGATGVDADARITERHFEADILKAEIDRMALSGGKLQITGIDKGKGYEMLDLEFDAAGQAAALMTILDRPPLHFARFLALKPSALKGSVNGRLNLAFPPIADLDLDDVEISAIGRTHKATIPGAVGGRDITDARFRFNVDKQDLRFKGKAGLSGVPLTISGHVPFAAGAKYRGRYVLIGRLGNAARAKLGLSAPAFQPPVIDGTVGTIVTATQLPEERVKLNVDLDMSRAALAVSQVGWRKPAGGFAAGKARLTVQDGVLKKADSFQISGPGMRIAGAASFADRTGRPTINFRTIKLGGGTDIRATVKPHTKDGYEITFGPGRLDMRPMIFANGRNEAEEQKGLRQQRLLVKLNGPTVKVRSGPPFHEAHGEIYLQGDKILRADIAGRPAGSGQTRFRLDANGALNATAQDAGALLLTMGLPGRLDGGKLVMTGTAAPDLSAIDAKLRIENFKLVKAPTIMRVLQLASITGPLELLAGSKGLQMTALEAPFTLRNKKLTLKDGRIYGGSLGVTFRGGVDIPSNQVDVKGAVVPIYVLNRLLSAVPLVGDVLTGGEGLFAVSYSVSGKYSNTKVEVHPLSLLAPGGLRRLLTD